MEFALKHPWLTALLVVPTVVHGGVTLVVGLANAVAGKKDEKKDEKKD